MIRIILLNIESLESVNYEGFPAEARSLIMQG